MKIRDQGGDKRALLDSEALSFAQPRVHTGGPFCSLTCQIGSGGQNGLKGVQHTLQLLCVLLHLFLICCLALQTSTWLSAGGAEC